MQQEIIDLFKQGLCPDEIANKIGHRSVTYISKVLRQQGLLFNNKKDLKGSLGVKLKQCSKCLEFKHVGYFVTNRKGQKYEYQLSYCNVCRHKQLDKSRRVSWDSWLKRTSSRKINRNKNEGSPAFTVSIEYLKSVLEAQNYNCVYSGEPLVLDGKNREVTSLDRVDNSKPYEKGNVVFCKYKYNIVKNDLTLEEFKKHLPKWYKNVFKLLTKIKEL